MSTDILKSSLIKIKLENKVCGYRVNVNSKTNEAILLDRTANVLAENPSVIILEAENISDREFLNIADKIKILCSEFDGTLIVKSRADFVYILEADGILLNENSIQKSKAAEICPHDALIGYNSNIDGYDFVFFEDTLTVNDTSIKVENIF